MTMTAERDLRDQIAMLDDAIAEGSPAADRLREIRATKIEQLSRATGTQYHPTDDVPFAGRRGGEPASNQFGTFQVHAASERQIAFIRRLVEQKDTSGQGGKLGPIKIPAELDTISKKSATALIDRLMGCPDKPRAADARPACRAMASDKQLGFLRKLLGEKDLTNIDAPTDPAALSVREASALIDALMAAPRKQVTEAAVELESGIYRTADDRIYKVYTNQARSRMLAKLLVLEPGQEPRWEYAGTAYRFVQADQRMTLEQAKQFGAIYGVCCNCGATLTDEGSIEAGIGPVCAKKGNWA